MRYALTLAVVLLVGCGGGREERVVPDVRGAPLDRAENMLADQKLDFHETGATGLGVLVRSNWTVCAQRPAPGKLARTVELTVARSCPKGPVTARRPVVPDVVGDSLEAAKDALRARGISVDSSTDDGDAVLVDRLWTVCDQQPYGGARAAVVHLDVSHQCWGD